MFWPRVSAVLRVIITVVVSRNIVVFLSFGWWTKVYVWKRSAPSNVILHRICLTKGSTLTSQDHDPRSVVYVSKPTRAIWRYLLSEFCALLSCSLSQSKSDSVLIKLTPLIVNGREIKKWPSSRFLVPVFRGHSVSDYYYSVILPVHTRTYNLC